MQLVDSTHFIDPSVLHAHGVVGIIGYLEYGAGPTWKTLRKSYVDIYRSLGIAVGGVFETNPDRAITSGGMGGTLDADRANAALDRLGVPDDVCANWSLDSGVDASVVAAVRPYGDAFHKASKRPCGVYAGYDVIEDQHARGNIVEGWQPNASSWSHGGHGKPADVAPHATIVQSLPANSPIPNTTDGDTVDGRSRMLWWPANVPTAIPTKDDAMTPQQTAQLTENWLRLVQLQKLIVGDDLDGKGDMLTRILDSLWRLEHPGQTQPARP
jgi:hypothetical protein